MSHPGVGWFNNPTSYQIRVAFICGARLLVTIVEAARMLSGVEALGSGYGE